MLDIFLVLGFIAAIFLVERLGRIRLQLGGFVFMTVGLLVLALASGLKGGLETISCWSLRDSRSSTSS